MTRECHGRDLSRRNTFGRRQLDRIVIVPGPALNSFVRKSLQTIWMLETFLLIRRVGQDEIVRELRPTPFHIRRVRDHLSAAHCFVADPDCAARFEPSMLERLPSGVKPEIASRERPIAFRNAIINSGVMTDHDLEVKKRTWRYVIGLSAFVILLITIIRETWRARPRSSNLMAMEELMR